MSDIKRCQCGSERIDVTLRTVAGTEYAEIVCGTCEWHSAYQTDSIPEVLTSATRSYAEACREAEEQGFLLDGAYPHMDGAGHPVWFCFEAGRFFGDCWWMNGRWRASFATVDNGTNRLAPCECIGEYDTWEDAARALFARMRRPLDAAVAIVREAKG